MADSPYIIDVSKQNYAELMEASFRVPVVLDFWADWCQPCHMLMPVLASLADEYAGTFILGKLNTEQEPEIAAQFNIRSIPTVKLFRDGQAVDGFTGVMPEGTIRDMLDRHVARGSDAQVAEARERLEAGDTDGAITLLNEARDSDPDNPRVTLAMAEAQVDAGLADDAEATLKALPIDEQDKPEVAALRSRLFFERHLVDVPAVSELEGRLATDESDLEAMLQLAFLKVADRDYDAALELLLTLMRKDRSFGDDVGRQGLLKVFDILGNDPRVSQYRRKMASLLN